MPVSPIIFNEDYNMFKDDVVPKSDYIYLLQRYNALFNGNFDIVYMHDAKGNLLDINDAGTDILGYSRDEFLKMNLLDIVCPEHHAEIVEIIKRVASEGSKGISREYKVKTKAGKILWLYTRSNVLINENNQTFIQGFAHDTTHRKRYEDELVEARKRAEESDSLKSAFLANMSHEIRTPLNAILGFAELISTDELELDQIKDFSALIHKNGEYLLNILSDIIDVARIESGQVEINKEKVLLNMLLKEVEETIINSHSYREKQEHVRFELQVNGHDPELQTDAIRLKQVLFNLINNGIKYTSSGYVKVSYTLNETHIQITVSDTGTGISNESKEIIFERFGQAENTRQNKLPGTGLGLSICKGLVELMGGKIWMESEPGKGSKFHFTVLVQE
ncbi:ATP-binding protein [Saccharicrinis sp. FJH54]|uniref:PAS domain-containing sensor histidine kinase n=1 Tax=Saccharicrinis sp. FJH54 TaxID=3344665 RepID=UPI0035D3E863